MSLEAIAGLAMTFFLAVAGWVWSLAGRLTVVEMEATTAKERAEELDKELAAHKDHVAAEYVSRSAMKEVTDALNRVADRIDSLFLHFIQKSDHD